MATSWETEPRSAEGIALRPWDPTTTVPAILEAAISVVGAKPVTLWGITCTSGAVIRTTSVAAVRTGSLLAGASLAPSCCLSVITSSFSRACTTCSGPRVRRASSTAQRRANSLEAEPSTPTTTLPSAIWWVLIPGSLGTTSSSWATPAWPPAGSAASGIGDLGVRNLDESLAPGGQMDVTYGLRSSNGDPDDRGKWSAQRACGIGGLRGSA